MTDESLLKEMMTQVIKIGADQEHLIEDVAQIKADIHELHKENQERDERIKNLELNIAKSEGRKNTLIGLASFASASFAAGVTAVITWMLK